MRWRSVLRVVGGSLIGLALVLILSACLAQAESQPSSSPDPPSAPTRSASEPASLPLPPPPNPAAIASSVGASDLYNPPRGAVRLAVISDLNSAYGSTEYEPEVDRIMQLLPFWQPDLVLCGGDMVAGQNPSLTPEEIQAMWAAFDTHVAAPLRQANLPFGFTIGNHDASGAQGSQGNFLFQRERDLATAYWQDPAHDPGVPFIDRAQFPFYYTFASHGIFFLVWDGSTARIPAEKLNWVEQALASEQSQQAKMRLLLGHLPLYGMAVGRDEPGEVLENAEQLRGMLERYNVHTYISGHQHAYYPGHRGQLQLLHSGILGAGPRPLIDSSLPPRKTMTLIDITFDTPEPTTYTTYDAQTLELIATDQLPRFLAGHNGLILRQDITWDDLDATEKAVCEQRLGNQTCRAASDLEGV